MCKRIERFLWFEYPWCNRRFLDSTLTCILVKIEFWYKYRSVLLYSVLNPRHEYDMIVSMIHEQSWYNFGWNFVNKLLEISFIDSSNVSSKYSFYRIRLTKWQKFTDILVFIGTFDRNSIDNRLVLKETLESTGAIPYLAGLILPLINSVLRYSGVHCHVLHRTYRLYRINRCSPYWILLSERINWTFSGTWVVT